VSIIPKLKTIDYIPISVVVFVSMTCVVVFLIPPELQNALKAKHSVFNPIAYITASFVHTDLQHLGFNLAFFALFTFILYFIGKMAGKERLFIYSVPIMFLLLPLFSYSLLHYIGIFRQMEFGFGLSLVDSGMIGLTVPMLTLFFKARAERFRSLPFIASMVFFTFSLILVASSRDLMLTVLSTLLAVLFGALTFPAVFRFLHKSFGQKAILPESYLVIGAFVAYFFTIPSLFPSTIISEGGITDILSHYIGLMFGIGTFSILAVPYRSLRLLVRGKR